MSFPKSIFLARTATATLAVLLALAACQRGENSEESSAPKPEPSASSSPMSPATERELERSQASSFEIPEVPETSTSPAIAPSGQSSAEDERERRLAEAERQLAARERVIAAREARVGESRPKAPQATSAIPTVAPKTTPEAAPASETAMVPDLSPLEDESSSAAPSPDPAPAEPVREPLPTAPPAEVPTGTQLSAELLTDLASNTSVAGQAFRTRIAADVRVDGEIAIPAGSEVHGYVVEARAAKGREKALLELRITDLVLPTGETFPLAATVLRLGQNDTGRDVATVGGAAAGGAILGRAAGGKGGRGKGALVGAILGAVVGAVIASRTPGEEVVIARGELLDLRLDQALSIGGKPARP